MDIETASLGIVYALVGLLIALLLFAALDYGNRQARTDTEAVVIYRTFASPVEADESIYVLILKESNDIWKVRVPKEYFYSVDAQDRVMLTRYLGLISGKEYNIELRTEPENYYQMSRAKQLESNQ